MADETDIMDAEFTETEQYDGRNPEQSIGETPAEQTSERRSRSLITAARSIPVGNVGAMPVNFAQQVDLRNTWRRPTQPSRHTCAAMSAPAWLSWILRNAGGLRHAWWPTKPTFKTTACVSRASFPCAGRKVRSC